MFYWSGKDSSQAQNDTVFGCFNDVQGRNNFALFCRVMLSSASRLKHGLVPSIAVLKDAFGMQVKTHRSGPTGAVVAPRRDDKSCGYWSGKDSQAQNDTMFGCFSDVRGRNNFALFCRVMLSSASRLKHGLVPSIAVSEDAFLAECKRLCGCLLIE